jgi:hypothetical protein
VTIDHLGAAQGAAVAPGGSAFLNEEEQILTANAPLEDKDNPFSNGALKLKTRSVNIKQRRPYGDAAGEYVPPPPAPPVEETGAPPVPAEEPPVGTLAAGEEVATPEAAGGPATMRKRRR